MGLADKMAATEFAPLALELLEPFFNSINSTLGGMSADARQAKQAVEKIEAILEGQQQDIDRSHGMLLNHQSQLKELAEEKEEMKGVVAKLGSDLQGLGVEMRGEFARRDEWTDQVKAAVAHSKSTHEWHKLKTAAGAAAAVSTAAVAEIPAAVAARPATASAGATGATAGGAASSSSSSPSLAAIVAHDTAMAMEHPVAQQTAGGWHDEAQWVLASSFLLAEHQHQLRAHDSLLAHLEMQVDRAVAAAEEALNSKAEQEARIGELEAARLELASDLRMLSAHTDERFDETIKR